MWRTGNEKLYRAEENINTSINQVRVDVPAVTSLSDLVR